MSLARLKPAAPRVLLVALAGLTWAVVGSFLVRAALGWLRAVPRGEAAPLATTGLTVGVVVWRLGFSRIARRNLDRLERLADPSCLFAFQAWRSYLLIGLMVAAGVTLRHSSLPRTWLAVVYATMGAALLLGSGHYAARLLAPPRP